MRPHRYEFGNQPWPSGKGVLQVYAPIDLGINPDLAELINRCRAAVRDVQASLYPESPGGLEDGADDSADGGAEGGVHGGAVLAEVDNALLHITLDVIADCTEDQVPQSERDMLITALSERLTEQPVYRGSAGSCLAYGAGVMLDTSPAGPLVALQAAVRGVIRGLRGAAACTWRQPKPHISTHYCAQPTESDPWQRRLRAIDPNHAPLTITSVLLVNVTPDTASNALDWNPVSLPIALSR